MQLSVHRNSDSANAAAADTLASWLVDPATRNVMVAAGNTPIPVYGLIAARGLALGHLRVFMLDEYVGVPASESRSCAGLLRRTVAEAWRIPPGSFFTLDPDPTCAHASVVAHEERIRSSGGLDAVVLGLGQNGHLGFNEPGSTSNCGARVVDLESISTEANRKWFGGDYTPNQGATVGLGTVLASRRVLLLAFGPHKVDAVKAMIEGVPSPVCPASFLQGHPDVHVFLDEAAARRIRLR